ncbi:MAG: hypothetical protein ISS57_02105 [Anaerolineales bacterium]|nr:hypothetical protein [Chloroflexota bacterium]MBL7161370.1 hypothetical protein [Anaerolineales bacterium]
MRLIHHFFLLIFTVSQLTWITLLDQALALRVGVYEYLPYKPRKAVFQNRRFVSKNYR